MSYYFPSQSLCLSLVFSGWFWAPAAAAATVPETPEASLVAGQCQLGISTDPVTGGVSISMPDKTGPADFQSATPLMVEVLDSSGATNWLSAGYSSVARVDGGLRCAGQIHSPNGTEFDFTDIYRATNAFLLDRLVKVLNPNANDVGFMTRFSLEASRPMPLREQEVFIPGIWYLNNQHVRANALAGDVRDSVFLIREDRMALPLVMIRNPASGVTIALNHYDPDGSTCLADYHPARVVDARIQVGSLGIWSNEHPAVSFCYPATEGERSYLGSHKRSKSELQGGAYADNHKRWEERFHPVQVGVQHSYQLMIQLAVTPDFPTAMRQTWRAAYEHSPPAIARTDVAASYAASIKLISDWSQIYNGCPGLPFCLRLPKGELDANYAIMYQMGFVGQQLPLAYQLLRYGLQHRDEKMIAKGAAMMDFWVTNSLTAQGLPRTWFEAYPQPHWRHYDTFLRLASDGMVGALMAWDFMQAHVRPRPEWLRFCKKFGDWLVTNQNADGSWFREYDWDSHPVNEGRENTPQPIRFLVDLSKASGEEKYLKTALRAGNYCYTNVHRTFTYVGGTADNPNVMDKEAGILAMEAFLALHDATGEKRWLDAAVQAGDFTETWLYCWNIPFPADDPANNYPRGCTTTAFSLITTGHSGADLFMAAVPFLYYRLYLETGDAHYADIARQTLYNTKQGMDINGSLGYGHTGLCTEGLTLAPPRGHGVNIWLPWLSWAMIDPLTRLQDAYGMMDTPTATGDRLAALRAEDAALAKSRGLWSIPPGGQNGTN